MCTGPFQRNDVVKNYMDCRRGQDLIIISRMPITGYLVQP